MKALIHCHSGTNKRVPHERTFMIPLKPEVMPCDWKESLYFMWIVAPERNIQKVFPKLILNSSLGKFYGRYGDLIKHYEVSLFPNVTCHFGTWPYTMTPTTTLHQCANLLPNWTLLPILTWLPTFGGFHRTLERAQLANRGRLLLLTPGPVPFGTCICCNIETILSLTCHVFWVSNVPRYFYFAL